MWLEDERHNSVAARNQRWAAIHAFVRFINLKMPEYLLESQRIHAITSKKHSAVARKADATIPDNVSPHMPRHSKAMHLLQAGVNLIYIRDFLGHAHVDITEIYARADTGMKRAAIEKVSLRIDEGLPDWTEDMSLMSMLMALSNKTETIMKRNVWSGALFSIYLSALFS